MKKTKVFWTISPLGNIPSAIFDNPDKYPVLAKCPVVGKFSTQTRIINTPYDLTIKPKWRYNQVIEEKEFKGYDISSKDLIDENLWSFDTVIDTHPDTWTNRWEPQFQIVSPYIFMSEEDIQMNIIGLQASETKSKIQNLRYIEAVLDINKMARPLSSAWTFINNKEAHFIKGQPFYKLLFSEPVELFYFSPGPIFTNYCKVNNGIVNFQKRGTVRKFPNIFNRQPKKLFKEIKENIVYGEA